MDRCLLPGDGHSPDLDQRSSQCPIFILPQRSNGKMPPMFYPVLNTIFDGDKKAFIQDIHDALYASKIISYAQGYMLMKAAALNMIGISNYGGIALMWRGGCIIRSAFLGEINQAYDKDPQLANLLLDDYFKAEIDQAQSGWRRVIARAVKPEFRLRLCPARWLFTMATVLKGFPPIYSKPSGTSLAPIPTNGWTNPEVSSSTPIGLVKVGM